jgi:DNA/RNA endonuclease YhcR with UshA esterase domain
MKRKIIFIILGISIIAVATGIYMYNKPTESNEHKRPTIITTAETIFKDYAEDDKKADEKYLGKLCEVTGKVASIETDESGGPVLALQTGDEMFVVSCNFEKSTKLPAFTEGTVVTVKGECSGLLSDVVLDRCILK